MSEVNEHGYRIEGELPEGYPEPINYAWFPTAEMCDTFPDIASFEGFLSLHRAFERYWDEYVALNEANVPAFEIVPVAEVEEPTIIV